MEKDIKDVLETAIGLEWQLNYYADAVKSYCPDAADDLDNARDAMREAQKILGEVWVKCTHKRVFSSQLDAISIDF
jgi:hypothetical protein